jgi:hypothetical protein
MSEQKAEYVVAPFEPGETVYHRGYGEVLFIRRAGPGVYIRTATHQLYVIEDSLSREPWPVIERPVNPADAHRDHVAKLEAVVAAARTAADMIDKRRWKHTTAAADECVENARTVLVKALDALEGK